MHLAARRAALNLKFRLGGGWQEVQHGQQTITCLWHRQPRPGAHAWPAHSPVVVPLMSPQEHSRHQRGICGCPGVCMCRFPYAAHFFTCFGLRVHYLDEAHAAPGECVAGWLG